MAGKKEGTGKGGGGKGAAAALKDLYPGGKGIGGFALGAIPLADLVPDPKPQRSKLDDDVKVKEEAASIKALATSINSVGLQVPLKVQEGKAGKYVVRQGNRRLAALLGIQEGKKKDPPPVPCLLMVNGAEGGAHLAENVLRRPLTVMEQAKALDAFLKDKTFENQKQAAKALGTSEAHISHLVELIRDVPKDLQEAVEAGKVSAHVARQASKDTERRKALRQQLAAGTRPTGASTAPATGHQRMRVPKGDLGDLEGVDITVYKEDRVTILFDLEGNPRSKDWNGLEAVKAKLAELEAQKDFVKAVKRVRGQLD